MQYRISDFVDEMTLFEAELMLNNYVRQFSRDNNCTAAVGSVVIRNTPVAFTGCKGAACTLVRPLELNSYLEEDWDDDGNEYEFDVFDLVVELA